MKKTFYIIITTVLTVLLSFIIHALVEIAFLNWAEINDLTVEWNSTLGKSCALPLIFSAVLLVVGFFGGIWLGFIWWKMVYVKRGRGLFIKVKK